MKVIKLYKSNRFLKKNSIQFLADDQDETFSSSNFCFVGSFRLR